MPDRTLSIGEIPGMRDLVEEIRPIQEELVELQKRLEFTEDASSGRRPWLYTDGDRRVAAVELESLRTKIRQGEAIVREQEQRMVRLAKKHAADMAADPDRIEGAIGDMLRQGGLRPLSEVVAGAAVVAPAGDPMAEVFETVERERQAALEEWAAGKGGDPAAHASAADQIAAAAVEIPAGAPEWIMLMPAGRLDARDGRRWRLTDADAVVAATHARAGSTDLVIDYEHQTKYSSENGQPAPAAGWITELEARAGALWARTRWTDQAAAALRAREYRYLSPWFMHTPDGVVTCLSGAALTNTPALDMPALA